MAVEAASIIPIFIFGDIKRLVLRRIQAIKHAMVEISGIEPLTS